MGTRSTPFSIGALDNASLGVWGYMRKVQSIKCTPRGEYQGGYEGHPPWMELSDSLTTFLDDADSLLDPNANPHDSKELLDCLFLLLHGTSGLILLPENRRRNIGLGLHRRFRGVGMYVNDTHWERGSYCRVYIV